MGKCKKYNKQVRALTGLFILLQLLFSVVVLGQSKKKLSHMTSLDLALIDHAELYRYTKIVEDSTMGAEHRSLDPEQIKCFADHWNTATYKGICKVEARYRLDLYFKDGSKRSFRINKCIKEDRNHCFKPVDKKYLKRIWKDARPR